MSTPGAELTIAICGDCKTSHATTVYMANRYPNNKCKVCEVLKNIKQAEQSVKNSVSSFEYYIKEFKETLDQENKKLIKVLYK